MKVTALVESLLKKAGIQHDEAITDELPDEIATQLDNALLTIQAATNNHPQVKKAYFAKAYNGLDQELENLADEFELDDETRTALKAETSSTKRAALFVRKIKELEGAKANAKADPAKVGSLQKQIDDLHKQLKTEQDNMKAAKAEYESKIKDIHIQAKLSDLLGQYQTVYDELPVEAKNAAVHALVQQQLKENDAEFGFDEKGDFVVRKKDGTNLFGENHTQLTPKPFLDKAVSKILKVTPADGGGNNSQRATPQPAQAQGGGANTNNNAALSAKVAESLQNYEKASKSAI